MLQSTWIAFENLNAWTLWYHVRKRLEHSVDQLSLLLPFIAACVEESWRKYVEYMSRLANVFDPMLRER